MSYMKLPIKMIGLTAGFSAGILGATHMALEDLTIIRSLPNITVISPADGMETMKAILQSAKLEMPVYLRMCSGSRMPIVYKEDYNFQIGKGIKLRYGNDACIFATGTMVYKSLQVAERLSEYGLDCEVVDIHTIKPIDEEIIRESSEKKLVVSVEEHSKFGGLGSAIAEVLSPLRNAPPHLIIGVEDCYPHAATYETLIERSSLDEESIFNKVMYYGKENSIV